MNQSIILEIYLANIRLGVKSIGNESLTDEVIRKVVNTEYHKLRSNFDREVLPKLSEDEIEEFFETLNSKTEELIDLLLSKQ